MKLQNTNWSRREFFRSSSLMLGAVLLSPGSLFSKAKLGSSISVLLSYQGKQLGVKFTMVNEDYVIATIRVLKGKKLGVIPFQVATSKEQPSLGKKTSIKMQDGVSGLVMVDPQKGTFSTNVKGIKISRVKFDNSNNDDIPSTEGFFKWLGDKITDAAKIVAAGITWMTGNEGIWNVGNGSIIVGKQGNILIQSGFMAEDGVEEQPGIWY